MVLGFALDQREGQDDAQVMPCKLITREKEEKLKMDPKLCLHVGNPEHPGLEMPSDERPRELQVSDPKLKKLIDYLKMGEEDEKVRKTIGMSDQELVRYKLDEHGLLLRQAPKRFALKRSHKKERKAREKGLHYLQESTHRLEDKGPVYQRVIPAVGQVRAVLMSYFHGSRGRGHAVSPGPQWPSAATSGCGGLFRKSRWWRLWDDSPLI